MATTSLCPSLCVHGEREREGGGETPIMQPINTCNGQEVKALNTAFESHRMGMANSRVNWCGGGSDKQPGP